MNFTVKLLRTADFTEYELGLPLNDIDEYFLIHDWLNEFKNKDYLCIELTGDIKLDYEETLDIEYFNNLLLEFKKRDAATQEKVTALMELNYNTVDSLRYALDNCDKFILVPDNIDKEHLTKYVFEEIYTIKTFDLWSDCISSKNFITALISRGCAFSINGKILIKSINLKEGL